MSWHNTSLSSTVKIYGYHNRLWDYTELSWIFILVRNGCRSRPTWKITSEIWYIFTSCPSAGAGPHRVHPHVALREPLFSLSKLRPTWSVLAKSYLGCPWTLIALMWKWKQPLNGSKYSWYRMVAVDCLQSPLNCISEAWNPARKQKPTANGKPRKLHKSR